MNATTPATVSYDMPLPAWLRVGAEVALIRSGGIWGPRITGTTTVEKLTKRDIVLANGTRFRHKAQTAAYDGEIYYIQESGSRWLSLCAADGATAKSMQANKEREGLRTAARNAAATAGQNMTVANAEAAVAALQEWIAAQQAAQ